MLYSQVRGLPVVTLAEAAEIGVVKALTVDAAARAVTHVRVGARRGRGNTVLPWEALHAVGPDAVLVRRDPAADTGAPPAPAHHEALRHRILTEAGDERGTVQDLAFDPATGRVETVYTALGTIPADRLLGLGDYALVVRAG
ncbi:PRC-barrel domain-containing protein [Streptomyces sp. NPDC046915]|uniref:PRC-barrel domain-containing protein n=1 Tax=Streptomyces sp. NPDC046915 TaxID=3155257 RepID=UPI0033E5B1EB